MLRSLCFLTLGVLPSACSSSDPVSTPADTGTAVVDTGTVADTGGETDPGVNGCADSDYIDATADETKRKVAPWNTSLVDRCIKIKKGQSVTWDGVPTSFHPLEAGPGDTPNPITDQAVNTFPKVGTFGFHCTIHTSIMKGAIKVVE